MRIPRTWEALRKRRGGSDVEMIVDECRPVFRHNLNLVMVNVNYNYAVSTRHVMYFNEVGSNARLDSTPRLGSCVTEPLQTLRGMCSIPKWIKIPKTAGSGMTKETLSTMITLHASQSAGSCKMLYSQSGRDELEDQLVLSLPTKV
jgi:hypothetical protein